MRIVFFASSPFAIPTLERLSRRFEVALVVSQPDRPAGRGSRLRPTPVVQWTRTHLADVPVATPEDVNTPPAVARIRSIHADAFVVIAYGQKLSSELLSDVFAINLHASLLPRWRGAAPIHAAILAGDTRTGNTVITLADRMDAGLICAQEPVPIEPSTTTGDLHDLLADKGAPLVEQVLQEHARGTLRMTPQDEHLVTYARKISRQDARFDPSDPADLVRRRINALSPRPGVLVCLSDHRVKLLRATTAPRDDYPLSEPGTLVDPARGIFAGPQGQAWRLLEVQPAGGRPMTWSDFARGRRPEIGERLSGATP